jgi:hypothetical protein
MAVFEINLAEGRVIPAARRHIWFCALLSYIAIAGLVFVFLANRLTRDLMAAREQREHLQLLENRYLGGRPQQDRDIIRYANAMGTAMDAYADTLETIDSMLTRRVRVAHILFGLTSPLPADASLFSVDLSADKRELVFEVLTPEERSSRDDITPPSLIAAWERNPDISRELAQITSVNRQRILLNGQGALIWRFTAHLAGKGI